MELGIILIINRASLHRVFHYHHPIVLSDGNTVRKDGCKIESFLSIFNDAMNNMPVVSPLVIYLYTRSITK